MQKPDPVSPVVRSMRETERARAMGGGSSMEAQYVRQERENERRAKERASSNYGYGFGDKKKKSDDGTVICTELRRQKLLTERDCVESRRDLLERLTPQHERGYHIWAVHVVRKMRVSRRWTRVCLVLAKARADHIAYLGGDRTRRNLLGHAVSKIGEPLCFIIGAFVPATDWTVLYES